MVVGLENLTLVSDEVKEETRKVALQGGGGGVMKSPTEPTEEEEGRKRRQLRWRIGELEFEAMMRQLDNMVRCRGSLSSTPHFH